MPNTDLPPFIQSESQLDELLSEPSDTAVGAMSTVDGDLMLLGVGGKMGPSLARMAKRCSDAAGSSRKIFGVSRFSSPETQQSLEGLGVSTIQGNLLDENFIRELPDVPNIVFMTGMKFGASGDAARTWAMNVHLPAMVCQRFAQSRILAFSTGNVYPLVPIDSGGSVETDPAAPVGEYAMTALGRERMFEYFCQKLSIPTTLLRLNYSVELRYGVLLDIARQVQDEQPIDLTMGYANVIWQRDANAMALCALADAKVGPLVVNCAGPELVSVRETAETFGHLLGKSPHFVGEEQPTALLNNGSLGHRLYGSPTVPVELIIQWIAHWLKSGGRMLNKPTHFQTRDGKF